MIGWENIRELNGDYFRIYKSNKGGKDLDYYLDKIDIENYWVYKATDKFRRVEVEDIGKYAGYIFFIKDLYCREHIDKWIGYIHNNISLKYLSKPFPRIEILEKLEVI